MLNRAPIFIAGFQRGGTDLLWYLLLSHPGVCRPEGETHQVFRGRWPGANFEGPVPWAANVRALARYLPVLAAQREDVFSQHLLRLRRPLGAFAVRTVDRVLYGSKLRARAPHQNRFKTRDAPYTDEEIARARLLAKNVNGLIFLSPELSRIYPDATFVALVRNGYAVCEGHMRRGATARAAAALYDACCSRIAEDAEALPGYHVLHFEELVAEPAAAVRKVYGWCGLSPDEVPVFRLPERRTARARECAQAVPHTALTWYRLGELADAMEPDADRRQLARLSTADRETIGAVAGESLARFGYAGPRA